MASEAFDLRSDENLGSMEIALAISLILFGIIIIQAYNYYQNFQDRWLLRSLVTVVLTLEAFHTFTIAHNIYLTTVTHAGRKDIGPNSYPLTTGVVLETLITSLVQSYFSYRIYRLSKRLPIPVICWTLSFLRLVGGLALAVESYRNVPLLSNAIALTESFGWLITLAVSVGAAVDVLIAVSLCYYIKRLAPPDPSQSIGALVDRLMTYTIRGNWACDEHDISGRGHRSYAGYDFDVPIKGELQFTLPTQPVIGACPKAISPSYCPHFPMYKPEKALNSNATFRHSIDTELEARGHARF
ncbi:hypothetical protein DXG01_003952 [Tephrocybe rancida]|nr:hypothetical protein DXG01_003952 [Tephrocybe rancida]